MRLIDADEDHVFTVLEEPNSHYKDAKQETIVKQELIEVLEKESAVATGAYFQGLLKARLIVEQWDAKKG